MRNQEHGESPQVDPNHGETGQTGHATGHGSLRRRLRRVLADGIKGLAHGVLADEIDRLTAEREQAQWNARTCRRRLRMASAVFSGLQGEHANAAEQRDEALAEVERLRAEVDEARAEAAREAASGNKARSIISYAWAVFATRDAHPNEGELPSRIRQMKDRAALDAAEVKRLKAENDDLKRTNANLHEAYEREHKEAAALRRRVAGPATMLTAGGAVEPTGDVKRVAAVGDRPLPAGAAVPCHLVVDADGSVHVWTSMPFAAPVVQALPNGCFQMVRAVPASAEDVEPAKQDGRGVVGFCPECGPISTIDPDGLCASCGATATGAALEGLLGEVQHLKRDLHDAKAARGVAETESRNFRAERDDLHDTIEAAHLALADALEDDCDTVCDGIAALVADRSAARAEVERLKAEGEDLKRTNADLHEAYKREHKEAAALRRRLAGPATMPARDTDPTGQKVVTADGRLADVCFDGMVRPAKPALVVIESPHAGDVEANVAYARAALLDSLRRGEAPLASHLLYTQVLDDQEPEMRALGISAGAAWTRHADKVAVYQGRGISDGMRQGIALAESLGIEVEYREVVVDERAPLLFSDETVQHDGRGVGYVPTTTPEPERTWSGVLGGAIHHETAGGIVIPDDATAAEEG